MLKDFHTNPFYKPLWVRAVIVGTLAVWTAFELFVAMSPFWGVLAVALLIYCTMQFFVTYPKDTSRS